ncbi:16S rRNA (guanine(527)-N(7))-methyltransferase RsmG [Rhodoferax koreense]|uniref:Ribosomal RNA small subunit methyltransferase G n=1 Tax=Rhodoferax koreensis TaxID=1842727 RepID=A0A1P8JQ40_9BURK|nr:16S rRNA (guanine(527)-N(7))-methyltransferase RsmG [Rhodoferax koreense]APW35880.1 16S rRNA (guanine(527)-N(7))-methyltransferase RsmG [Rhodoferax koreense]
MSAVSIEPAQLPALALQMGLSLDEAQLGKLLQYLALIQKWNKVYNLTALREPAEMFTHHLLDSLAAVPPLQKHLQGRSGRLLDVGSGAGLPGVVFAICCPGLEVSCVDTVGKKAAFVQQAAAELGLRNLRGVHARVESLTQTFDVVSSRAFASLADFTAWSKQALAADGVWLAMKGKNPVEEVAALPPTVQVFHVEQLKVPGLDAERCIVWMRASAG